MTVPSTPPAPATPSPTELVNPATTAIDQVPTAELLAMINAQDALVPGAVAGAIPVLAGLVDAAVAGLAAGGHVHYVGAGTSGRLGVMDAAELLPTYGIPAGVVIAHLAGGDEALVRAIEDVEDDEQAGARTVQGVGPHDVVIGLAASGGTPFVGAALRAARAAGAVTALVTSNPNARLAGLADHLLVADTGPEAVTGSTRMKAGTAAKLILNSFSTAVMVRRGHTFSNLMVDMVPTNAKLRLRSIRMIGQATGITPAEAESALSLCGDVKTSVVFVLAGLSGPDGAERARTALRQTGGFVRQALEIAGRE